MVNLKSIKIIEIIKKILMKNFDIKISESLRNKKLIQIDFKYSN